jgi:N-acetylmuramic acid 6-phosphate etherase
MILEAFWEGQLASIAAIHAALPALERAGAAIIERLQRGGRLVYVGAGASGQLALQDGLELPQTFGWPTERLVVLLAGGDLARHASLGGAEDDAAAGRQDLAATGVTSADVVIGVAASGTTPYTVAAMQVARDRLALTVGIANNADTALLNAAEHPILLDTGAEVIAGSTRMNAGTAQKAALNLLSSLVMIKLGHVFDGYMIDLHIDNAKLRERGLQVLTSITAKSREEADAALTRCQGRLKPAVLVLHGLSPTAAEQLLQETAGSLRTALSRLS